MSRWVPLCMLPLVLVACGHDFEPPDRGERVERAGVRFTPMLFDTITWADVDAARGAGNLVYAEKCTRCHGPLGAGDTEYARGRGLVVPSIVQPAWGFAELDSLRRKLYVGHEVGMPIFGEGGLSNREIDAAARYVLETLRPEVLER